MEVKGEGGYRALTDGKRRFSQFFEKSRNSLKMRRVTGSDPASVAAGFAMGKTGVFSIATRQASAGRGFITRAAH
jgi:hypothetical protein